MDLIGPDTDVFSPHSIVRSFLIMCDALNTLSACVWVYCVCVKVTPRITGLFNGEALRAMYDVGIYSAVGDNSQRTNSSNPYHALITSISVNGFDGVQIIPRYVICKSADYRLC